VLIYINFTTPGPGAHGTCFSTLFTSFRALRRLSCLIFAASKQGKDVLYGYLRTSPPLADDLNKLLWLFVDIELLRAIRARSVKHLKLYYTSIDYKTRHKSPL
jgi:hypothetical protein